MESVFLHRYTGTVRETRCIDDRCSLHTSDSVNEIDGADRVALSVHSCVQEICSEYA